MEDERSTMQVLRNAVHDATRPTQPNFDTIDQPTGLILNAMLTTRTYNLFRYSNNEVTQESLQIAVTLTQDDVEVQPSEARTNDASPHSRETGQGFPPAVLMRTAIEKWIYHQREVDVATPLPPKCRTFRLSEVPIETTEDILAQYLDDNLEIGNEYVKGKSHVFSLAPYTFWQVATVSFHEEPDEIQKCQPDKLRYLIFAKRRIEGRAVPINVTVNCDFNCMTPVEVIV
jgi:hypothetical protein